MNRVPLVLRLVAVLSLVTGATIAFIEGFSANPILNYPWGLPIADATIAAGLACWFAAHVVEDWLIERRRQGKHAG